MAKLTPLRRAVKLRVDEHDEQFGSRRSFEPRARSGRRLYDGSFAHSYLEAGSRRAYAVARCSGAQSSRLEARDFNSAVGATKVSPAVHGWEKARNETSAVGTTPHESHVRFVTASKIAFQHDHCMGHTYSSVLVHCVFSTKERRNLIRDPQLLWRYLTGIAKNKSIPLIAAGGTSNHVHLLLDLPPTMELSQVLQVLKGNSSHWLNEEHAPFAWQQGYGAFAVGESQRATVIAYIDHQAEHHRKRSFEQEFVALLQKYGIAYDDRFVFG